MVKRHDLIGMSREELEVAIGTMLLQRELQRNWLADNELQLIKIAHAKRMIAQILHEERHHG